MNERTVRYSGALLTKDRQLAASMEEVRMLFVVTGGCTVTCEGETVSLKKADFYLVNAQAPAAVELETNSYVFLLALDYFELCQAAGDITARFLVNSRAGSGPYYSELRSMLQGLTMCYVGDRNANRYQERGIYYLIIQALSSRFAIRRKDAGELDERERKALEIVQYVRLNYRADLSMTAIADRMFLSRSTASRLFKRVTGENFPAYLKKLRLQSVKNELERTDRPIGEIALSNGFSTPSALNTDFKKAYGLTPKEYRDRHYVSEQETPEDPVSRGQVLQILKADQKLVGRSGAELEVLRVNTAQSAPWKKWENRLLNVGHIGLLQSASVQRQVLFLQERLQIEYLRLWNPFSRQMPIFGERKGEFNFTFLDEVLDFCVDHRFKVFLDLSMRRIRALASEKREIFGQESTVEFDSEEDWLAAVEALLTHLRSRYGNEVVGKWIFELTFFLNDQPYYRAKNYDKIRVWERTAERIKRILPQARVAGPGLIPDVDSKIMEKTVGAFIHSRFVPEIFTSALFPYLSDSGNIYRGAVQKEPVHGFMGAKLDALGLVLDHFGFKGERWVVEWGIALGNRNYIQDSCFRGANIVDTVLQTQAKADVLGLFFATDLLNAFSDSSAPLSGSGGLLSRNGFRKPAYYGYRFLASLGSRLLGKTDHAVITMENDGDIRALCWNAKSLGPSYYLAEEDSFRPRELEQLFADRDPQWTELVITGLEAGKRYRIRHRVLNEERGSVLRKWISLGCSNSLSREDVEYLEQVSIPEVTSENQNAVGGVLRVPIRLEPNEMRMINITKE